MLRRLTIGLRYSRKEAWVGGLYYVRNLVRALGLLPVGRRPRLVVIGGDAASLQDLREATDYQDLRRISRARLKRTAAPRLGWPTTGESIDLILMGSPPGLEDRGVQWVPDFQEHRFPQFFPEDELRARYRRNEDWFARHRHVMVSSQDVASDLDRYYGRLGAQPHIVRFAVFNQADLKNAEIALLKARYGLPGRYFIGANQFWRHKNHGLVLRALAEAAPDPGAPPVGFTGLEQDHRDPAYGPSVRTLAAELGLADRVRFLGFIPRTDQLGLMAGAIAVVQPSLCEGWSTVVEDAKSAGRHVLASDIAVHREQLSNGVDFFAPDDAAVLAGLLRRYSDQDPPPRTGAYGLEQHRFSRDLWEMIRTVERDFRRRKVEQILISG